MPPRSGLLASLPARLWPQRLATQLMAAVLGVLWLSIAGFGLYAVAAQSAVARAALEAQAATLAQSLAWASQAPVAQGDLNALAPLLRAAAAQPLVHEVAVIDPQGRRLGHAVRPPGQAATVVSGQPGQPDPPLALPAGTAAQLSHAAGAARITAWQPVVAGTLLAWVRVDLGTDTLDALRMQVREGAIAAGLLAGLFASLALRALLARPLRALQQAREFADGLQCIEGQQLPATTGPAEMRELAGSLNRASTRLLQMHQAMDGSLASIRRHELALMDTNEQLRTIFQLSPDALICFDEADVVSYTNPAFHRLTGLPTERVLGYPAAMLEMRLRSLCAQPASFPGLARYFDGPAAAGQDPPQPHRLTLLRPHLTVLEVVGASSEAPSVRRLLYLRDITHESEVDRMKSEFLSMAAHELRTPMTSIHACIELLQAREFALPRRQQMLGVMQRQSQVLMNVVDELLDLARIEARGGADIHLEDVRLDQLLRQGATDHLMPQGRSLPQLQEPEAAVLVRVDAGKTARVLANLLSNAYKYSTAPAVVELRMLTDLAGGRAGFEVRDHGIGMTPEQLARVGQRFYRADPSGHVPGTGLGITIVREILMQMGGRLELRSTPGAGTRATVWLPAVSDHTTLATIAAT